jgi:hypothetical protein
MLFALLLCTRLEPTTLRRRTLAIAPPDRKYFGPQVYFAAIQKYSDRRMATPDSPGIWLS